MMTPEERKKLDDLHDAFFKESPKNGKNLITAIHIVCDAYDKGTWLGRIGLWSFITLASVFAGWDKIVSFFKGST